MNIHQDQFNYQCTLVPECGSPGCAVGWVAHFRGVMPSVRVIDEMCMDALGIQYWGTFVPRMDSLERPEEYWRSNADECAAVLRRYAARHHATDKAAVTGLPDIVREIFTNPRQTISETAVDQRFA